MVGNSNDNTNFLHELLLTNRQVANIRKTFANTYQQILNCQGLSYQKRYNQKDFLVNF